MSKKTSKYTANLDKFPPYSLPKLYGWHLIPKQDLKETGKIFKHFGANWWDLLLDGKLPLHKGKVTLKTSKAHAMIFINIGKNPVKMTNSHTGDVYNVMPGKRSQINNTFDKTVTFKSSRASNMIHLSKIGSIWLILLQVQEVEHGESFIRKTAIFNDFLLMTGIPDKDQYLNTVGLETLESMVVDGWKYKDSESGGKSDFTEKLLEHWDICNPSKKSKAPVGIPNKVHWIWLRRDPHKKVYGKLKPVFYKFMWTWIERNPDFQFNLWTDNPDFVVPKPFVDYITVRGPKDIDNLIGKLPTGIRSKIKYMYKNHLNVGARSDTIRQCILYFVGGIYADVNDGACLAPMDKMFKKFDYMIGMEPVVYVNNAIIASKKKHIITKYMISWLAASAHDFVQEWEEDYLDAEQEEKDDYIVSTTGPIALTWALYGVMQAHQNKLKHSLILPSSWFYPNYWIPEEPGSWLKPVSIAAHFDRRDFLK